MLEAQRPPQLEHYQPWLWGFAGAGHPIPEIQKPVKELSTTALGAEGTAAMGHVGNGQSWRSPPVAFTRGTLHWEVASSPQTSQGNKGTSLSPGKFCHPGPLWDLCCHLL